VLKAKAVGAIRDDRPQAGRVWAISPLDAAELINH
jgi:hypothetical protein